MQQKLKFGSKEESNFKMLSEFTHFPTKVCSIMVNRSNTTKISLNHGNLQIVCLASKNPIDVIQRPVHKYFRPLALIAQAELTQTPEFH